MKRISFLFLYPIFCLTAQQSPESPQPNAAQNTDYMLAPYDQISIIVGELQDQFSDKSFRIDGQGDVSLPLVGRLHAAGQTIHAFEDDIKNHLKPILKHPDVVVSVSDMTSQQVSVLGAVRTPGVQKLYGSTNLFNVLSLAGGLTETAGTVVRVTRDSHWGPITLPGATADSNGNNSTVVLHIKDISQAGANSMTIMPGDTIFVPKASIVYAVGDLTRPGGFPIGENERLSALQVVSLAGGLTKTAASNKAKILRVVGSATDRTEIAVDLKKLMAGKTSDIPLQADDILFVPNSDAKSAGFRTIDAIVNAATGLAMYGTRF